jgi:hypothetical protein
VFQDHEKKQIVSRGANRHGMGETSTRLLRRAARVCFGIEPAQHAKGSRAKRRLNREREMTRARRGGQRKWREANGKTGEITARA